MYEYNFDFKESKIKVTIDVMGHEQVFVNGKQIISSRKWTLKSRHDITVDDIALVVDVSIHSFSSGQYQVALYREDECIEAQVQTYSLSNENITVSKEELAWQKEVEIGSSYRVLAYALYFSLLIFGLLYESAADNSLSSFYIVPVMIVMLFSVKLFITEGITALRQREPNAQHQIDELEV